MHLIRRSADPALHDKWSSVDGLRMYSRAAIDAAPAGAPAAVLVHGLGISSSYMVPLARTMARHFRTFAPDMPGFGWSDKPYNALSLAELADVLARWMEVNKIHRPLVVGNSMGCQVIIELAVRHSELVGPIVLQGPTMDPRARTTLHQAARWFGAGWFEPNSLGFLTLRDYFICGTRRYFKTLRCALAHEPEKKLPHIHAPTLVVRGSLDLIVSQYWAEDVADLLPDGELVVIPGVAHAINYAAPLELTRVTLGFLRRRGFMDDRATGPASQPLAGS